MESISRFARNTKDLLELVEQLTEKGVEFVSKKETGDASADMFRLEWIPPIHRYGLDPAKGSAAWSFRGAPSGGFAAVLREQRSRELQ